MRSRGLDNFKHWRNDQRQRGIIKSNYPSLKKDGNLAELIGVVLGDGHICSHARCESLRITGTATNIGFTKRYAYLIGDVFGKNPTVAKMKTANAMTITIYEKEISKRLGIPAGNRFNLNFVLPKWIEDEPIHKIRFLRGLYEAEGSLSHHTPTSTHKFIFSNRNQSLLNLVYRLITELGFTANMSLTKVQVSRRAEVQNLTNLLGFRYYDS